MPIPCPRLPLFVWSGMLPPSVARSVSTAVEGKREGVLSDHRVGSPDGSARLERIDGEVAFGELLWLDLSSYDDLVSALDESCAPAGRRVICRPRLLEDACEVECWTYLN